MAHRMPVIHDKGLCCPFCDVPAHLQYTEIPPFTRSYEVDGETYERNFPQARDYECTNCGAQFTYTNPE